MRKKLITAVIFLFLAGISNGVYNTAFSKTYSLTKISQTATLTKTNQQKQTNNSVNNASAQQKPINTTSLAIVNNPEKFLNKTVKMQATFDKFSTLGLDYSKAMRKSTDYIGILIQRDDVTSHNIPLSEMKLFLPKATAEKFIDLNTGDKIEITAKVFSKALNDPWLDITEIKILAKAKKDEVKK